MTPALVKAPPTYTVRIPVADRRCRGYGRSTPVGRRRGRVEGSEFAQTRAWIWENAAARVEGARRCGEGAARAVGVTARKPAIGRVRVERDKVGR